MSNLRVDLDLLAAAAQADDPAGIADNDLEVAAQWISVMLEDEKHPQLSVFDTMRKHPELVAAHAKVQAINRLECTYRGLKVEELRLSGNIAASLESIARAAAQPKGKNNE